MKPTQEKILSAIQENKSKKELLSVQKVELETIKDIKDFAGQAEFNAYESQKIFNEAHKKAKTNYSTGIKFAEKGLKMVETFMKKVKELGIDMPKEATQMESSLKRSEKTLNEHWKNLWN